MLFVLSYAIPQLFAVSKLLFISFLVVCIVDILQLFRFGDVLQAHRICPDRLSNGDENLVQILVENQYPFWIGTQIIDETPFQFQMREAFFVLKLQAHETYRLSYFLRPTERGEYDFGAVNAFVYNRIGFFAKRYRFDEGKKVAVYPSYIQLRKYELLASTNRLQEFGLKKIRRIGHSMEFEQIKEYVMGDDYRTLNWKASARANKLMVNHFTDEKAQQIYLIIDKGRQMQMPFNGLTLLDYSINTSLIISSVALKKSDKVGLIAFDKEIEGRVLADRKQRQMYRLQEALYKLQTDFAEADYEKLSHHVFKNINQRSLLILFTNYEAISSMRRNKKYLQSIAKRNVLVIVFFENTELEQLNQAKAKNVEEIYVQTIGQKFAFEKRQIVKELNQSGIFTVLSKPEQLSMNTVNKYLELKANGTI